jgi:dynein light intermediate chain 1
MSPGSEAVAPARNPFPFKHKPNTLDRDRIVVPAGWDSWGKIGVMREGFDAKQWGEAWERDLDTTGEVADDLGAKKLYAAVVPNRGTKVCFVRSSPWLYFMQLYFRQQTQLPPFNNPMPEQAFLAKNYDENAKKPDRDPRDTFRNPTDLTAGIASIVGPMGSSSLNLPTEERALSDMEVGIGGTNPGAAGDAARRMQGRAAGRPPSSMLSSVSTTPALGRQPVSPTVPGSPSPTVGQTQHEVLQNFFQSLLTSKDRPAAAGSASSTRKPSAQKPNGVEEGA